MTFYRRPSSLPVYGAYAAYRHATHGTDFLSLKCDASAIVDFFVSPIVGLVRSPMIIAGGIIDAVEAIKSEQAERNAAKEQKKHAASARLAAHRKAMADGTRSPYSR